MKQRGEGIHLRQFARTFIVQDEISNERIVFVSVDSAMIGHSIKRDVNLHAIFSSNYSLIILKLIENRWLADCRKNLMTCIPWIML